MCYNIAGSLYLQMFVRPGEEVAKGSTLMTVEGMKMEVHVYYYVILSFCATFFQTNIIAIRDGQVKDVFYSEGDSVPEFSTVVEYADKE